MNRGFTLIELLISLALMVMLMLGVNYIFGAVGAATGNANALSKIGRDQQAAASVFAGDFGSYASDGACILINSQIQPAFSHQKDQLGAKDSSDPLIDEDGNAIPISTYNDRNHRTDILSFFARGAFRRRTGNDGVFVSDMSSNEAWIWYGHLMLGDNRSDPNDATVRPNYMRFGAGDKASNPNNFFASQWVLGRVATLLIEPDNQGFVLDPDNVQQRFWKRKTAPGDKSLSPLSQGSQVDNGTLPSSTARYDVAGTSISGFRNHLESALSDPSFQNSWFNALMLNDRHTDPFVSSQRRYQALSYMRKGTLASPGISSESFASMAPIFLQGCSGFIVEFAGDFFKQDATTGAVIAMESDGETDYAIQSTTGIRQIRWYGMPRDTSGPSGTPDGIIKGDGPSQNMVDVVPLTDVMLNATPAITPPTVFVERKVPTHQANYANSSDLPTAFQYIAAWGPDVEDVTPPLVRISRPILIRLVVTQDDAQGRISDGVTNEYIFSLR